ncbi:MAG TPA: hypothetical protein VJU59_38770 [Paraburkholderia sp.]|uniref:hypothetical protein n=1 Tax=Paraburkholderia sp. TaxID=1926495 RepID=UPI002B487705|nr:hypothetical protein [Paraburkholderia sp.]HKR45552.1 hypothetical protein [Paraburkholderia sp.]
MTDGIAVVPTIRCQAEVKGKCRRRAKLRRQTHGGSSDKPQGRLSVKPTVAGNQRLGLVLL